MAVTLNCFIVGARGAVFPVDIEANKSVGHLKEAIKATKMYQFPADTLQLYLAKKKTKEAKDQEENGGGEGKWLTQLDALRGVNDTDGYKHLEFTTAELRYVGLDSGDLGEVSGAEQAAGKGHVHVLAVVPDASNDGVFKVCGDPLFSQFPTVDEVNGWLQFPTLLPLTERQMLYVRSSYKSIADQALSKVDQNRRKYAVITGTPGIGKSVFVYYVMWRLIKEKKRVLLFDSVGTFYFDSTTMLTYSTLPDKSNLKFWSTDLWCLVDSLDPTGIAALPYLRCSILLASTPRRDCIGEFRKLVPTPVVLYMPLWTKEELGAIVHLYPKALGKWENRLECLGGVPRLVLENIESDPQVLLESACKGCSLDECKMLVSINSEINSRTKILQTLIHIHSQEPYLTYDVIYASELAMQVIARTKVVSDRRNMESLLSSCNGNPIAQALCGYIFEPYCLKLLHEGGVFEYRELFSGAQKKKPRLDVEERETITIPSSSQPSQIVDQVENDQLANQLYVPQTSNYAAIDAWMPKFGGFQVTVGKKHDIKGGAAKDLMKLGPGGNRLFFLLPPLYYNDFTKKKPQSIKQFAILVPYPEEI